MTPYPTYKHSGLPWLGDIPAHWVAVPIRRYCRVFSGGTPDRNNLAYWDGGTIPWLSSGEVNQRRIIKANQFISELGLANSSARWLSAGSVVMALAGQGKTKGMVATLETVATCNQSLAAICPILNKLSYVYLAYSLEAQYARIRGLVGDDLRDGLNLNIVKSIVIAYPPPAEQATIVAFLDRKGDETDRFLSAKRRLITLLREQKAALITQAVTHGLNPDAPTKASGVAWLGEVPAHWEMTRLKRVTRFFNGFPFKPADWKTEGVPIIRIQNLNGGEGFNYTGRDDVPNSYLIQPGDLMFAWSGNVGTSFGPFIWSKDFPGYLNQHIFRLTDYTYPKTYFYWMLKAVTRYIEAKAGGIIGLVHVTKPELGDTEIPLIPVEEQNAIAAHIDREGGKIDNAIARTEREMELIHEYRATLISEAVTGKWDVRQASQNAPHVAPILIT